MSVVRLLSYWCNLHTFSFGSIQVQLVYQILGHDKAIKEYITMIDWLIIAIEAFFLCNVFKLSHDIKRLKICQMHFQRDLTFNFHILFRYSYV